MHTLDIETRIVSALLEMKLTPIRLAVMRIVQQNGPSTQSEIRRKLTNLYKRNSAQSLHHELANYILQGYLALAAPNGNVGRNGQQLLEYELGDYSRDSVLPDFSDENLEIGNRIISAFLQSRLTALRLAFLRIIQANEPIDSRQVTHSLLNIYGRDISLAQAHIELQRLGGINYVSRVELAKRPIQGGRARVGYELNQGGRNVINMFDQVNSSYH
jgi:Fe2+ or Zn2+ uptake regulation protein